MICPADESMLPGLMDMWQICFDESREGTEFAFSNLLNPEQMLVCIAEGGRPAAMLSWKLLRFATPFDDIAGAYIFGVATLPEYRGRGFSRALMGKLDTMLRGSKISLACLVPADASLFGFYRELGFETGFSYRRVNIEAKDIPDLSGTALSPVNLEEMEERRNSFFAGRGLFGAWDTRYLRYTGLEFRFYGGEVLRFLNVGQTGYVACYPQKDGVIQIREVCAACEELPALLAALHVRFGAKSYELRLPVDFPPFPGGNQGETVDFAMLKWCGSGCFPHDRRSGAPWFAFGLD